MSRSHVSGKSSVRETRRWREGRLEASKWPPARGDIRECRGVISNVERHHEDGTHIYIYHLPKLVKIHKYSLSAKLEAIRSKDILVVLLCFCDAPKFPKNIL